MIEGLNWIFIFNVIVNSFLSFLSAYFLLHGFLWVLKPKNPRCRSCLYLIPVFKLLVDFYLYRYGEWALAAGSSPLLAEVGSRILSVGLGNDNPLGFICSLHIGCSLDPSLGFSLADVLALSLPLQALKFIVSCVLACSVIRLLLLYYQTIRGQRSLRNLLKAAEPYRRSLLSDGLEDALSRMGVRIYTSPLTQSPFATGIFRKTIVLPRESEDEWLNSENEAAIAHELEHLKYYDHCSAYLLQCIEAVFWWVPLHWARRQAEAACEEHCDQAVIKHGLCRGDLAQVLLRLAKSMQSRPLGILSSLRGDDALRGRIMALLEPSIGGAGSQGLDYLRLCLITFIALSVLISRLWLF